MILTCEQLINILKDMPKDSLVSLDTLDTDVRYRELYLSNVSEDEFSGNIVLKFEP